MESGRDGTAFVQGPVGEQMGTERGWPVTQAVRVRAGTHFLSKREIEILQLVANGASNQEIADNLGISQQTVKNHLSSVFSKLRVKRRGAAAAQAIKQGLVVVE